MARIFTSLIFCFSCMFSNAQTVFWTETFNNGCTSGCFASGVNTGNGAWAIDNTGGCNDNSSNDWFISCAENGNAVTTCGTGCGSNATLHIGANDGLFLDIGASYDAGSAGGCCGCGATYTYTYAVSPLISTVGKTGISVSFDYLEFGNGAIDDGWVDYSTNGGTTWNLLINTAKTTCCGGPCNNFRQGRWANYTSATLPVAAENNANFKIRFAWTNNDDGVGTDPSFAINDLKIRYLAVLPIEMLSFDGICDKENVTLYWTTASEQNNNYFTIEKSENANSFLPIGTIEGAGNSDQILHYSFIHTDLFEGTNYYRIKQTDFNGQFSYSKIIAVNKTDCENRNLTLNNCWFNSSELEVNYFNANGRVSIEIYSPDGRVVQKISQLPTEMNYHLDVTNWSSGIYFIRIFDGFSSITRTIQK